MVDQPIWITFIVAFVILNVLLISMAYMTWYERKVLAYMQDRVGPTRSGPHGLLQPIADAVKLLGKEDLIPGRGRQVGLHVRPGRGLRGRPDRRLGDPVRRHR